MRKMPTDQQKMPIDQWSGEDLEQFKRELFEAVDNVLRRSFRERLFERYPRTGQRHFGWMGIDRDSATLRNIILMKARGTSYRKIANILNFHGVPTKRKGTKWHGWTINKMVDWICCYDETIRNALTPLPPPPKREFLEVRKLFAEVKATEMERDRIAWENAMALAFTPKRLKSYDELSDADVKRIMRSFFLEAKETLRYMVSAEKCLARPTAND